VDLDTVINNQSNENSDADKSSQEVDVVFMKITDYLTSAMGEDKDPTAQQRIALVQQYCQQHAAHTAICEPIELLYPILQRHTMYKYLAQHVPQLTTQQDATSPSFAIIDDYDKNCSTIEQLRNTMQGVQFPISKFLTLQQNFKLFCNANTCVNNTQFVKQ